MVRICEARSADGEDEAVLGLKRGRPIHYFQSMGYNRNHKLLELSVARYRGTRAVSGWRWTGNKGGARRPILGEGFLLPFMYDIVTKLKG